MAYLSFLFLCLVWGSNFILLERASHAFGPVAIALGRLAGGAAVLTGIWLLGRRRYHVAAIDWARITMITLVTTALPFVIQPYLVACGYGHSFFGTMVVLVPLVTIVVSVPLLGQWPSARQVVGVLGGLVCMWFIVEDGSARGMSTMLLTWAIVVPITYAVGNVYVKWKLSHVPALPLTTLLLAIAALMLVPLQLSPTAIGTLQLAGPAEPHDWLLAITALVLSGVVATGIAVWMFVNLIIKQGPLFAGMVTYVVPVLALLWGMFDNETITLRQLAAMVGVLVMVALVQVGAARRVDKDRPESEIDDSGVRPAGIADGEPAASRGARRIVTRVLWVLLAGLWVAGPAYAQPVTLQQLGCVPNDPMIDNGAIIRRAIRDGRVTGEILCGGGAWYHTTPMGDAARDGVSFRGAGVAMWNVAGEFQAHRRGDITARFIYTGPPDQPAWQMTGFGWRLTGINIWHGWKGELPCEGTGIEVLRLPVGPPAGKGMLDHCTIANFETGLRLKGRLHCDNIASTWLRVERTKCALWCDNPQAVGFHFDYLAILGGCDSVFRFNHGGNLDVDSLVLMSPALVFDLEATDLNSCAYSIEHLKVDNNSHGWRLVQLPKGPLRLRVSGMIGGAATPGERPVVVPANSDVEIDLWHAGRRWQWNE